MTVPTDRILILIVAATGFAIVFGGWAAALVQAEATGIEELALRIGIGVVFASMLAVSWYLFSRLDAGSIM